MGSAIYRPPETKVGKLVSEGPAVETVLSRYDCGGASNRSPNREVVSVEKGYDLWARTYDLEPNPLVAAEERVLRPRLRGMAGRVVLDVACGTGRWLEKLLNAGARSGTGVDASSGMLCVAKSKPALRGRVVRGDCLRLPFPSQFADLIVSSLALGHISDIETFAQELARVAKCRADVWISEVHPEARATGWTTGFRYEKGKATIPTFSHSVEHVEKSFQRQGFELCQCLEARLEETEKPLFAQAGKAHLFRSACESRALLICHFRPARLRKVACPAALG
jgi:ubiquinone/menaquinone biosynthesis C-methylase UbiE